MARKHNSQWRAMYEKALEANKAQMLQKKLERTQAVADQNQRAADAAAQQVEVLQAQLAQVDSVGNA